MIKNYSKTPWILEIDMHAPMRIVASDERATIVADNLGCESNESALNDAKLMANSPNMYEAIKKSILILDVIEKDEKNYAKNIENVSRILRNAIANVG